MRNHFRQLLVLGVVKFATAGYAALWYERCLGRGAKAFRQTFGVLWRIVAWRWLVFGFLWGGKKFPPTLEVGKSVV